MSAIFRLRNCRPRPRRPRGTLIADHLPAWAAPTLDHTLNRVAAGKSGAAVYGILTNVNGLGSMPGNRVWRLSSTKGGAIQGSYSGTPIARSSAKTTFGALAQRKRRDDALTIRATYVPT